MVSIHYIIYPESYFKRKIKRGRGKMLQRKLSNEMRITRYDQHFADAEKSCSLDSCLSLPCADF